MLELIDKARELKKHALLMATKKEYIWGEPDENCWTRAGKLDLVIREYEENSTENGCFEEWVSDLVDDIIIELPTQTDIPSFDNIIMPNIIIEVDPPYEPIDPDSLTLDINLM